jgi:hypothetical protein
MRSSRFRGPRGNVSIAADGEMTQEMHLAEAVPGGYAVRA